MTKGILVFHILETVCPFNWGATSINNTFVFICFYTEINIVLDICFPNVSTWVKEYILRISFPSEVLIALNFKAILSHFLVNLVHSREFYVNICNIIFQRYLPLSHLSSLEKLVRFRIEHLDKTVLHERHDLIKEFTVMLNVSLSPSLLEKSTLSDKPWHNN